MQYSHTKEKAGEFAAQALERIHLEELAPVPQNFELWYVYFSGANPEVVRAIDVLVANKQKITDERCEEIHQRFLSESRETDHVRQVGDRIQSTIQDVTSKVHDVRSASHRYKEAMDGAAGRLKEDTSTAEIRATLVNLLESGSDMMEKNQLLEDELARSTQIMQELQRDLELVRKQALTDGLTNLANRKAFDAEILRISEDAYKSAEPFCMLLMDIDHFKSFNDNFGHQVGDQVLRLVARTLIDGVKGRDLAARYGGEEFAILLPQTSLAGGMKVADSIRGIVQGKELVNRNTGDKLGRVTISAGVAEYVSGESVESIIERSDAALYAAKHNGRNQVVAAPKPGPKKKPT
ncbi:MAG: GGDEF domain-containing protein [Alphaproteobacteria bacterium]|nr:GGDEF domain-containing protein [Alphaproteobacteria bacterium]